MARNIANESDMLFERLKNNKNMTDKKDLAALNTMLERWRETNNLKTRIEEEYNLRLEEILENKRRIKELERKHEHALNQQQEGYNLAINAIKSVVSENANNRFNAPKIDFKISKWIEEFFSVESISIRNDKESTVRKDRDALRLFVEIIGDKFLSEIAQPDAVKFSMSVSLFGRNNRIPRAASTVNGFMNSVSKFSKWVATYHSETGHKKLDFSNLRKAKTKRPSDERQAFTDSEVNAILSHPHMATFKLIEPVKYWLPYIAAYSGARLEEITQLSPKTDIYELDGVWVFDINDKNGKSLKNIQSIRKIPIHSKLIKLGLLEYVTKVQECGVEMLFPNEKIRDGRTGKNAGKRVNRFIEKVIKTQGKTLHSFRHTFATKLKHAGVEEAIVAAILGHEHGNITFNRYGKDYLSSVLSMGVELINFD